MACYGRLLAVGKRESVPEESWRNQSEAHWENKGHAMVMWVKPSGPMLLANLHQERGGVGAHHRDLPQQQLDAPLAMKHIGAPGLDGDANYVKVPEPGLGAGWE